MQLSNRNTGRFVAAARCPLCSDPAGTPSQPPPSRRATRSLPDTEHDRTAQQDASPTGTPTPALAPGERTAAAKAARDALGPLEMGSGARPVEPDVAKVVVSQDATRELGATTRSACSLNSPSRCSQQSDNASILSCAALSLESGFWLTIG
jgi:hypothetical protein